MIFLLLFGVMRRKPYKFGYLLLKYSFRGDYIERITCHLRLQTGHTRSFVVCADEQASGEPLYYFI